MYLEGQKHVNSASETASAKLASVGGKGGGGRWLFVSHDPVDLAFQTDSSAAPLHSLFSLKPRLCHTSELSNIPADVRLVHFKFEAMVSWTLSALK